MKVLHICNDFCGSKVHSNLYSYLDISGMSQIIYTYMQKASNVNKNKFDSIKTEFIYSAILNKFNRIFYPYKESLVYEDLKTKIDVRTVSLSHATTLYSDGGIAYKLFKEFGIPYIIAVRATDIHVFMKIPFYWKYGRNILMNASKIIFISHSLKEVFMRHKGVQSIMDRIENKIVVIPNGIDKFWIENACSDRIINHQLCYIGSFLPRKNVLKLIDAVNMLSKKYPDIKLNIIGKGGKDESKVISASKNSRYINYIGPVYDKYELMKYLRSSLIFAMVSIKETFGLVYIEALSQNRVIIYTKNDGIDGTFSDIIGEAVVPNVNYIMKAICKIFDNPLSYSDNNINFSNLDWNSIAKQYINIYDESLNAF